MRAVDRTITRRATAALALAAISAGGLLYACGESLAEEGTPLPDRPVVTAEASPGDVVPPKTECDREKPFGAPAVVPVDGEWSIEAARFTANRADGYLSLCPRDAASAGCDLYVSRYENGALVAHNPLTASNSPAYDSYASVTADGKRLVFASRRDDAGFRIYSATATNGSLGTVVPMQQTFAQQFTFVNEPYLLGDGGALYFAAKYGAGWDIYTSRDWGTDAAATATLVAGSKPAVDEVAPVVSDDELEIFYGSNASSPNNEITGYDIYRATRPRAAADVAFGEPEKIPGLSGDANDWPVWISPDRCDLYFVKRDPATTVAALYVASRR